MTCLFHISDARPHFSAYRATPDSEKVLGSVLRLVRRFEGVSLCSSIQSLLLPEGSFIVPTVGKKSKCGYDSVIPFSILPRPYSFQP